MSNSGNDDLSKLRIDPNDPQFQALYVPTRIRKRRKDFAMLPMSWYDTLANPVAPGSAVLVAWHLCHLCWKSHGKPFKLPNGMLRHDGISRQSKWRALAELDRRGLITTERRAKKSPIIHLLKTDGLFQS
jgi:hypothetical protein